LRQLQGSTSASAGHFIFILSASLCYAIQDAQPHEQTAGTAQVIDGAANPELISDAKAYEVFFQAANLPRNASAAKQAAARDKFKDANLTDTDTLLVMEALLGFHDAIVKLDVRAAELRSAGAPDSQFVPLGSDFPALVSATQKMLQSKLSPEGATNLNAYVMD
jgi:hypothetical protein